MRGLTCGAKIPAREAATRGIIAARRGKISGGRADLHASLAQHSQQIGTARQSAERQHHERLTRCLLVQQVARTGRQQRLQPIWRQPGYGFHPRNAARHHFIRKTLDILRAARDVKRFQVFSQRADGIAQGQQVIDDAVVDPLVDSVEIGRPIDALDVVNGQ
jgi:hypothetical protein